MSQKIIVGLDPGPDKSAMVWWDGVRAYGMISGNQDILLELDRIPGKPLLVIEQIVSMGMIVGAEVFETCYWTGRFSQAYGIANTRRITRGQVKLHLCGSMRAKDANIRQAIIDRLGGKETAVGKAKSRGPLYDIKSHMWSALAVAMTYYDTEGNLGR